MVYRLVSNNGSFDNISSCTILWILLACIVLYVLYSGILRRKPVTVGVVDGETYETFSQELEKKKKE